MTLSGRYQAVRGFLSAFLLLAGWHGRGFTSTAMPERGIACSAARVSEPGRNFPPQLRRYFRIANIARLEEYSDEELQALVEQKTKENMQFAYQRIANISRLEGYSDEELQALVENVKQKRKENMQIAYRRIANMSRPEGYSDEELQALVENVEQKRKDNIEFLKRKLPHGNLELWSTASDKDLQALVDQRRRGCKSDLEFQTWYEFTQPSLILHFTKKRSIKRDKNKRFLQQRLRRHEDEWSQATDSDLQLLVNTRRSICIELTDGLSADEARRREDRMFLDWYRSSRRFFWWSRDNA